MSQTSNTAFHSRRRSLITSISQTLQTPFLTKKTNKTKIKNRYKNKKQTPYNTTLESTPLLPSQPPRFSPPSRSTSSGTSPYRTSSKHSSKASTSSDSGTEGPGTVVPKVFITLAPPLARDTGSGTGRGGRGGMKGRNGDDLGKGKSRDGGFCHPSANTRRARLSRAGVVQGRGSGSRSSLEKGEMGGCGARGKGGATSAESGGRRRRRRRRVECGLRLGFGRKGFGVLFGSDGGKGRDSGEGEWRGKARGYAILRSAGLLTECTTDSSTTAATKPPAKTKVEEENGATELKCRNTLPPIRTIFDRETAPEARAAKSTKSKIKAKPDKPNNSNNSNSNPDPDSSPCFSESYTSYLRRRLTSLRHRGEYTKLSDSSLEETGRASRGLQKNGDWPGKGKEWGW